MNLQRLVARYECGALSDHEFAVTCLTLLDPDDPSATLREVPAETVPSLREFVGAYRAGKMRSTGGGPIPTPEQVDAARRWFSGRETQGDRMGEATPGTPTDAARIVGS